MCPGDRRKKCIPKYKFCDGFPDCKHGTDEDPNICGLLLLHTRDYTVSQNTTNLRLIAII